MVKMNKWTMALAAAGVVSLSSVAQAQEAAAGAEALAASTTLSGYVSSSYTAGDGDSPPGGLGKTNEDTDHFKLDVVSLTLASAQGAGEYATGYTVQFWAGPDDGASGSDSASLQQANIDLRLPFGNGIDLKVGKFGTIVGHEVFDYNQNAFFQRGLGFDMEPTHHTGILASYQVTDDLAVQLGFANDTTTAETSTTADDGSSAYLAGLSYTLPNSMGFAGGTAITLATVRGASAVGAPEVDRDNTYLGVSLPSVVENLSIDFAADWGETGDNDDEIYQVYAGYALNDKATLNLRYEWGLSDNAPIPGGAFGVESLAIGLTYDLWENVTSRVEWMSTSVDNAGVADDNTLAFNLVYSF